MSNKATGSLGTGISAQNNYKLIVKTLNASMIFCMLYFERFGSALSHQQR